MIDRKTIALINGEVDGENTPEESATLRQMLTQDAEARKLFEDLKKLERNLASISPAKPPVSLKPAVMRSIQSKRTLVGAPAKKFSLSDLLFPVHSLPKLGFAFGGGVLAGVVLVILYLTVISHPSIDDRDVSGTILGSSELLQTADDAVVTGDGIQGRVITEYSNNLSVLRVNLTMRPDLQARFAFDANGAKLKGIALAEGFSGTLTKSSGLLEVGQGGGSFRAFFAPGASARQDVRLQVVSAGGVVYERSLPLGKTQ